ncbi:hypothetical protein RvY_16154 [Ramazzottius varieornatus]|uniref:Uncharacterized protein n=1 Tax=Ramazzottius varieornatus TaxID=947166 RepID=A0A1D1W0F0_RAMVA|nr:hypothetical protein RvY_16154 [Ramazzottius varieornatus]
MAPVTIFAQTAEDMKKFANCRFSEQWRHGGMLASSLRGFQADVKQIVVCVSLCEIGMH